MVHIPIRVLISSLSTCSRLIGRPFVNVPAALERCIKHLRPIVEHRQKNIERYGPKYEFQQDLLSWFMDEVDGQTDEEKLKHVAFHLLIVNFGAVYTISAALYHLAAHPECVAPLREEIEAVTVSEGWTKNGMGELRKLDSLLKESQRISGLGAIVVLKAMMAHVLMNYDVKLEKDDVRPKDSWFVTENIPNSTANVMFRKRAEVPSQNT
ncbi:hypothetical protein C0991_011903 [Blastosporella zonata]|nr:hypothetical protein C0991_011903 [Blastosporella zonata]